MPKRTGRRPGRPPGLRTYGLKIQCLRVELGLTVVQLADQVGLNQESIRRAERDGPVSDVFTGRIARALGVHMRDISDWDGEDVSEPETPDRISA